jgi:circadian clock protein KaiA
VYGSLTICLFSYNNDIIRSVTELLASERYCLHAFSDDIQFIDFIEAYQERLDCLIVTNEANTLAMLDRFSKDGIYLPAIVVCLETADCSEKDPDNSACCYHSAEIYLPQSNLTELVDRVELAIAEYLTLAPSCPLPIEMPTQTERERRENRHYLLLLQQRRLAEKLQERLGYLGVYYRRNPKDFYRNLDENEKQEIFQQLFVEYRTIILNYFENDKNIESVVDEFVNKAFFSDFSVSQILEIHMNLMDEFAQQLKLEGRSEEILLDYRLALIDIIAHLCELYRRSIPREDIPFELLFKKD